VEPVTKGIRIILQFDVEVVGWGAKSALAAKEKDTNEDEEEGEDGSIEGEDEGEDGRIKDELFYDIAYICRKRKRYQKTEGSVTLDNAVVTRVTDIIASLLTDGQEEVAFAMQHLYRKSAILPEFLKGADAQLYRALVSDFDVTLQPVVLQSRRKFGGFPESCLAIPWDQDKTDPGPQSDSDLESNNKSENDGGGSDDNENAGSEDDESTKSQPKNVTFHLPMLSAIQKISYQSYLEYTGNEAQQGEMKYFGGGMFVRQKTEVAKKE